MSILTCEIPANWPGEAKTLISDLRRAFRALEKEVDGGGRPAPEPEAPKDDDIARECFQMKLTPAQGKVWRVYRENMGKIVSHAQVMASLYRLQIDWGELKIVDVFVCKIRKRLKECGLPYVIETHHGLGKRLVREGDKIQEMARIPERKPPLLSIKIDRFIDASDLRKLCWAAGMTMRDLARELGVYEGAVCIWSAGHVQMPVKYGVQIADIFKAKQAALMKEVGTRPALAA